MIQRLTEFSLLQVTTRMLAANVNHKIRSCAFVAVVLFSFPLNAVEDAWPLPTWTLAEPLEVGLDQDHLIKARDYALTDNVKQHHPGFGMPPASNMDTGWIDKTSILHLATQTAGFEKPGGYERLTADSAGRTVMAPDVTRRAAVFTHAGRCYRSGISYNASLNRYLWCQIIPGVDTRFEGGFGIYDAPEPWGPWSMVYFTESWDVGPGESSSIPTKWISDDGRTFHLVFSGDDHFSVRRAELTITHESRLVP